jgi:photosystem II stability/assembly factor-like uncharacterized protein
MRTPRSLSITTLLATAWLAGSAQAAPTAPPSVRAAALLPQALHAPMLGMACAGARQVAVGDHGVVLLSDDNGRQWRQARSVPMDVTLTAVSFADARRGWAVGHRGVVLHTDDGGETWQTQRSSNGEDRPLFAVHFFNPQEGVAVGLWSTVLRTDDGGKTWQAQTTGLPKSSGRADLNLFQLFDDAQGRLYATAERGTVLRSRDRGRSWEALPTGHAGSLWAGLALPNGRLVVAGLRGALLRSDDDGRSWQAAGPGNRDSLTGIAASTDGSSLLAVGADGAVLRSDDAGTSFVLQRRPDRQQLLAIGRCSSAPGAWTLLGNSGPVPDASR